MSEKSDWEQGYDQAQRRFYEERKILNARIAELEGIIKSDDERLTEAGLKVNLYFGCDTAEIMAEEILSSRARISELEAEIERFTAHSDIERQDDKCSGHGDISNFPPVMGSGDGLGW